MRKATQTVLLELGLYGIGLLSETGEIILLRFQEYRPLCCNAV
jgi:hypothetical protein